jgi:hypothetical protein
LKLIYTNENLFLVGNAKNILQAQGIEVILKNQFAQSAIGETSSIDAWPELWLRNDSDYEDAFKVIESCLSEENAAEWVCIECDESNDASFEICWSCHSNRA